MSADKLKNHFVMRKILSDRFKWSREYFYNLNYPELYSNVKLVEFYFFGCYIYLLTFFCPFSNPNTE